MEFLFYYQYSLVFILLIILINYIVNNHFYKDTSKFKIPEFIKTSPPLISIMIPARNESKNIRRCLRSLARQDYQNFEILVLDDNSIDGTSKIVSEFAARNSRIRLFKGQKLPNGWLGKSYACHQLSCFARGEYFLFTDADTLHFKNSVSSAISALIINKLDALSVFARQITVTLHERMMVPFANFFILCFLPLNLIKNSGNPFFCTAIGQFLLFKKDVYKKIGGHKAIRKDILEDIRIAKMVKSHGFKFMIFDGKNNFYCRMYKNLNEVVKGFVKVLSSAFNYNILLQSLVTILVFAVFLSPFILLPLGILLFGWPQIIIDALIAQVLIILAIRIIQTIRFKNRFVDIFLHPLAVIYLLLISIFSMVQYKKDSVIFWKGRNYNIGNEGEIEFTNDNFEPDNFEPVKGK
ncbi:MAG: glycosyltransferase [Actinobacteria bacterium]|nr:glycosyltransferase [Actinomycetota bacterium]